MTTTRSYHKYMHQRKGFIHLFIPLVITLLVIIGFAIYSFSNRKIQNPKENTPRTQNQITLNPTTQESVAIKEISLPTDIGDALSKAFSTKLDYHWSEEGDDVHTSINVYRYSPGAKVKVDYYGQQKEYYLDQEVNTIKSLNYGKNIALIEGPFDGIDNLKSEVVYRKIGNRKFGSYSHSFAPAATDGRQYFTFDKEENMVIYVDISFYSTGNNLLKTPSELDSDILVKQFPQRYIDFLTTFEQAYLSKY